MCEQQYFIEYVLGMKSPSGIKADKGTIVHKALEILADIKLAQQQEQSVVDSDIMGKIDLNNYSFDIIIEKVYQYYTSQFAHHDWAVKDYKDCHKWAYKAITDNNAMFDPRNRTIIQSEQRFDIEIKKEWAKYKYDLGDEKLQGNLAIKGTIDLITKVNDNTLEIIDWKGLPIGTPIPTMDGWKTMGDLSIGDIVFDQYGEQCSVVGKSKVSFKPCYKITPYFETYKTKFIDIEFYKLDVELNRELSKQFEIDLLPTFIFIYNFKTYYFHFTQKVISISIWNLEYSQLIFYPFWKRQTIFYLNPLVKHLNEKLPDGQ